ncbi:MAG: DsbA family protein [Pirellulaceae bacterium]
MGICSEQSPATCKRLALTLGLDMAVYQACIAAPATDAGTDRRIQWLNEKDYSGLPGIWIENQGLLGAQTFGSLYATCQRAERQKASRSL